MKFIGHQGKQVNLACVLLTQMFLLRRMLMLCMAQHKQHVWFQANPVSLLEHNLPWFMRPLIRLEMYGKRMRT